MSPTGAAWTALLPRGAAAAALLTVALCGASLGASAQTRVLPLGDSITHGGQQHASYRYQLWSDLSQGSYAFDFVGRQSEIFGGDPPNLSWYPDYSTGFDPDHEGYWGFRTDEILGLVDDAAAAAQPDIVLVHLGTNDIGQNGAQGVTDADANLRLIIERLRLANPSVVILLARVIPIGCCGGYWPNADQVGPLNAAIDQIAADLDTPQSPVLLVDLDTGFDLGTMMQADGLHPNLLGETFMADGWRAVLEPLLPPGNPPPDVTLTAPPDGAVFTDPAAISLAADASDPGGSVVEVDFRVGGASVGQDTTAPYTLAWTAPGPGAYVLTAVAEDDEGATTTSAPVAIDVVAPGAPVPVPVANASFEEPVLADIDLAPGPGIVGGWSFAASPNTFLGIFNPPEGSYPGAGGNGTPSGADGANAAYLFNNGGPAEFVEATQTLAASLEAGNVYELRVAVGRFLPGQPYVPSSFGGYRIELRAGSTVIADDQDAVDPPTGAFADAVAVATADALDPALLGEPLSIRLTISATDAPRSTHFDDVRLTRTPVPAVPGLSAGAAAALALALGAAALAFRRPGRSLSHRRRGLRNETN